MSAYLSEELSKLIVRLPSYDPPFVLDFVSGLQRATARVTSHIDILGVFSWTLTHIYALDRISVFLCRNDTVGIIYLTALAYVPTLLV